MRSEAEIRERIKQPESQAKETISGIFAAHYRSVAKELEWVLGKDEA